MTRRAASGAFLASLTRDEGAAYTPRVPEDVFIRNRLSGPARHEVIGRRFGFHPRVDWVDLVAKLVIVAGAGAVVGMWLS